MDSYRIPTVSLNPNQKEKDMKIEVTFYNFVDADDLAEAVRKQHSLSTLPQDLAFGRVTL